MKFNFKKISAVLTSSLMILSGIGFAAAANFPSPFSDGKTSDTGIVYGANAATTDVTAATNINSYLLGKVQSDTGAPVGESVEFARSATKWHVGDNSKSVLSSSITKDAPGTGLPTLLADGTDLDVHNTELKYTQKIDVDALLLNMFTDNTYKDKTPTVGVKITSGAHILNYTKEYTIEPQWTDLDKTSMMLMGKKYYVLSETVNTTLNLLDAASSTSLPYGETKTLLVNGKSYEVTQAVNSGTKVVLTINGETTNALAEGESQRLSDGSYVGIKSITAESYAGGAKLVELAIGAGKLKLVSGSEVEINDVTISRLKAYFSNDQLSGSSTDAKLAKIVLEWKADGNQFIAPDSEVVMPGFTGIKLTWGGMEYPKSEPIKVGYGNDQIMTLEKFPMRTSTETIYILYGNSSNIFGVGYDATRRLHASNSSQLNLTFDGSHDEWFPVSYNDGSNAESYLFKATGFKTESSVNKTTFQYRKDGAWYDAKTDAKNGDTVQVNNAYFTVGFIDKDAQQVVVTAGNSYVSFYRLYSADGLKVMLPYTNDTNGGGCVPNTGCLVLADASSAAGGNTTFNLQFSEQDKNGNLLTGTNMAGANNAGFNVTIGYNSASTPQLEVSNVVLSSGSSGAQTSFNEMDDSKNFLGIMNSSLATEMSWYKPSSGQKTVTFTYHGGESYGQVYLASASATAGEAGSMLFKDSDKASWSGRNVILVGGSCINTATADVLGLTYPACESSFTDKTMVGSGQFIIATFADKFTTGKVAVVVAGYNAADTAAAANYLTTKTVDTSASGKTIVGTIGTTGDITVA